MDCDECDETYRRAGDTPPCDGCRWAPPTLDGDNPVVWRLWHTCHQFGREGFSGRLALSALLGYAERVGATDDQVERALALERELGPTLTATTGDDDAGTGHHHPGQ